jgi:hypothetical protein
MWRDLNHHNRRRKKEKGNKRNLMLIRKYNPQKRGENQMKHKLFLYIGLSLLVVLLMACGSVGKKADAIKCTGTQTFTSFDKSVGWDDGGSFNVGAIGTFNIESDCPELNGVLKVTENTSPYASGSGYNYSNWGIFRFETAYGGGGVFEGTYNGIAKNSVYNNETTSHSATGSLKGLQLTFHSINYTVGASSMKFEATIQNPPEQ